jgi:aspartyl-tRNA(Asn)/glutamyl-tRNA(Gln) amidotransferase subunit B
LPNKYTLTVGLEIHAELATKTKMFCDSKNDPDEENPNVNICPVCLGYPGSLPVINKDAVTSVLRLGVALGGEIADYTEFDRKNYFYPDIPKGYQVSQYKHPLIKGGELAGIPLTRIHLEEDTASSSHASGAGEADSFSLLDFNRAGVPLMELVTEPAIHDAETAGRFARELQLVLVYLGVSHANMEKGEMRLEANVSVSATEELGTKVEVKNLNSFKVVEKAIKYEMNRQIEILEKGEKVVQETRGWDDNRGVTFSQRAKEESHDYRYFPDPDLPKLFLSEVSEWKKEALLETLPELPWERRERYIKEFGLKDSDAEIYVRDREWGSYFEEVAAILESPELARLASNYITTDLKKLVPKEHLAEVVKMIDGGEISSRGAKDILSMLEENPRDPRIIASENNLIQKNDPEELRKLVQSVIDENKKVVDEYKGGKEASLQYLIGQAMKLSRGSGNPKLFRDLFLELLS